MKSPDERMDAEEKRALRVSFNLPAYDLTAAERAWCLDHPDDTNTVLSLWYRHPRRERRALRKAGEGPVKRYLAARKAVETPKVEELA